MNLYEEVIPYLLKWYEYNARVLPWREDPSPYHVWVSEIMLQQTRVEAVRGYYMRFLDELPDLKSLAACPDDRLMKLWEGLGYYSRARNLKKAAQAVIEQYGGKLPDSADGLRKLPGIGDYTAGAIASIAYAKPEPAVDGNVLRVFSRITGSREDITLPEVKRNMAAELKVVMPGAESGKLNQAIMDLGATFCVPNGAPHCEECPVMHLCRAFHDGTVSEIPVKAAPKARRVEQRTVFVIECKGGIVLHKRPSRGLLAGLWEYPNVSGYVKRKEIAEVIREMLRLPETNPDGRPGQVSENSGNEASDDARITISGRLPDAKHIFTHIEWQMRVYKVKAEGIKSLPEDYIVVTDEEMRANYSVPSAFAGIKRE